MTSTESPIPQASDKDVLSATTTASGAEGKEVITVLTATQQELAQRKMSTDLSPERTTFIGILKARYESNQHNLACHNEIAWAQIEAKLIANLSKLDALKQMNDSGGEPDMTGVEGGEFLFDDLAEELPDSRRNVSYLEAVAKAAAMGEGVKLMRPERYEFLGNEMGIVMDLYIGKLTVVWLDSENLKHAETAPGQMLAGTRSMGKACVFPSEASRRDNGLAFRCSLRV